VTGLGKLILRATLGGYFVGHGMQKLAGWFGGAGPEGTGQFFEQAGLRPGRESALVAGAAEAAGGSLLALGLFTPAAVSMITGVMTNAIRHVHRQNGLWVTDGGIEYPVVTALAMGAGAGAAVYVAKHGQELFEPHAADEALSRSTERVGAAS
jgi:putative oxidoreductase